MRGYLKKTEQGWFVVFDQRTMQDPSAEDMILPLEPKMANYLDMNLTSTTYQKEKEFEIVKEYTDRYSNQIQKYAKLVETDEKGNQLTYWGGLEKSKQESYICPHTNVQCDDECCVSLENCNINNDKLEYPISDDCEAVMNWDSFVEQKNAELEIERLAEISSELQEATYTLPHKTTYKHGFIDGYKKAKETLYTEEQVIKAIDMARLQGSESFLVKYREEDIIQSLKQK